MKVSLNTVKQFTNINVPLTDLVQKINSRLGSIEATVDLKAKYKDAVIVKIVEAEPHPNADRLRICKIDAGDNPRYAGFYIPNSKLIQVVCGAPNARAGIYAVWLPPASTVPASFDDPQPFILDARTLRGVVSQGMLAAADELAIGTDHDGIVEIDPNEWSPRQTEIKPGANFASVFGLDDTILTIENKMFTHRPDCFGVLGVAREIAGINSQAFKSPNWYCNTPLFQSGDGLTLRVANEAIEKVPRFMAVALKNVTVRPSPFWLQCELVRLGAKPINNIVDVTNYIMLLTGQPTHAYDYDKLHGGYLGARLAKPDEKITLLNHKTYQLDASDVVIVDGDGPVGLAGIMGGNDSEVSFDTTNIVLECATFDMYAVRKTSMRHGIFTDAVTRFNKGQSPLQNPYVLDLLLRSLVDVAGGEIASQIFDQSRELKPNAPVRVTTDFINQRLGTNLTSEVMTTLLTNVECKMADDNGKLIVTPPFWRTDIELPEDVVEEVGRLYGFDRIPRELPRRSIAPIALDATIEAKRYIRRTMSRCGANEVLSYSFVHENLLKWAGQSADVAFRLSNALSPDLQYYRLSLVPSLLAKVHANIKAGHDEFMLFEIGKVHCKNDIDNDGVPKEFSRIGGVFTANKKLAAQRTGAAYFVAKRYVSELYRGRTITFVPLIDSNNNDQKSLTQMIAPFDPTRTAAIYDEGKLLGVVGEFKSTVTSAFKLPNYTAGFELFLSPFERPIATTYHALSKFPSVTQDLSLNVPTTLSYGECERIIRSAISSQTVDFNLSWKPISLYEAVDDGHAPHKTVTVRITATSFERTLTDSDLSTVLGNIGDVVVTALHGTTD